MRDKEEEDYLLGTSITDLHKFNTKRKRGESFDIVSAIVLHCLFTLKKW